GVDRPGRTPGRDRTPRARPAHPGARRPVGRLDRRDRGSALIRLGLALLAGMALALLAVAASGEPGALTAEWLGWRLDTSAAAGAVLIGVLALMAVGFWRLVVWIGEAPRRAQRARVEARRRESFAALSRG